MATVRRYELFAVPPRWLFLKLETDDGAVGWGEPLIEGRLKTVRAAVEELIDRHLIGENVDEIERHWQRLYRGGFYRGGPILMSAIAGIDQALWDLKGKELGAPVHELMGGPVRDHVEVYKTVFADSPEKAAEQATNFADDGYRGLKTTLRGTFTQIDTPQAIERERTRLAAIREAVGDDVGVGVDFHGRISRAMAPRLARALDEYGPMFLEEPLLPEYSASLSSVRAHTTSPIATGERLFRRHDFRPLLDRGLVDVVQPDPSHAGGLTECKKIADMAAAYDVAFVPNCSPGPITMAACLQLCCSAHNAITMPQNLSADSLGFDYLAEEDVIRSPSGRLETPTQPGLGIEIDEEQLRIHQHENASWTKPIVSHPDGSVAER